MAQTVESHQLKTDDVRYILSSIKDTLSKKKLESNLEQILVPTHQVTEVKKGKRRNREKTQEEKARAARAAHAPRAAARAAPGALEGVARGRRAHA